MRNFEMNKLLMLALGIFVAACSERPTEPQALSSPDFATGGAAACPTPADIIVTDVVGLRAALIAASTGDVIAIDGVIDIVGTFAEAVVILTPGVTLTCATPGSGLRFASTSGIPDDSPDLSVQSANGVTIERLVLDAPASFDAVFAIDADDLRLSNNTVTCGVLCVFFVRTRRAVIVDNSFESAGGSLSGVHVQSGFSVNGIAGSIIQRNTIIATAPSGSQAFGAIRVTGRINNISTNVAVSQNTVVGPWSNAVAARALDGSQFAANKLEGADRFGILLQTMRDNVIRNNRVSGAWIAGINVRSGSCGNVFIGNNLQGNTDGMGAQFTLETGGNTLVGNETVVVDNGDFDCDGDGISDPNIINGRGAVLNGVNLGETVSEAALSFRGIVVQ